MSRTRPTGTETAGLMFPCAYCGALPDEWCSTGRAGSGPWAARPWARYVHGNRYNRVREVAELSGYLDMVHAADAQLSAVRIALREAWPQLRVAGSRPDPAVTIGRILGKLRGALPDYWLYGLPG